MGSKSLDSILRPRLALALALSLPLTAGIRPGNAATADETLAVGPTEEVIVTGSLLKRKKGETDLQVQVLTQEDIARTGATTTQELLQRLTVANSAGITTPSQATGNVTGGIATVSLRGMGAARTLVLINGRRTAVYGGSAFGQVVDIGAIPVAMIDHVEVLKDGASSVYGSDAIAGVVNFILRNSFDGLEATVEGGTPTDSGGGQDQKIALVGGLGDFNTDRYNATLGLNFQHFNNLMGVDRPFAVRYSPAYGNDVTSGFAFPANVAIPPDAVLPKGGTRNPAVPNCGPNSLADVNFPTQCRFDNSSYDSLLPGQTDLSATFNARLAVGDASELYGEASFWDVQTRTIVQPVPLSYQNPMIAGNPYIAYLANLLTTQYPTYKNPAVKPGTGAFLLPPTSPYYPAAFAAAYGQAGQPLNLIYRDFANGLRHTLDTAETLRLVGGYKGSIAGWDYDSSLLYSRVTVADDLQAGYPQYSKIMPLLDQGQINPFGPTTDPTQLALAQGTEFRGVDYKTRTSLGSLSGTLQRELFSLPAGALRGAIGAELRRETFEYDPALAVQGGDIAGQGGNSLPVSASRDVESAYVELEAPIAKGLDANIAGRFDNYQGVGHTINPKLVLNWVTGPWLLLRGTAGTGFRAPSLTDLYSPQTRSVTGNGTRDPIKCPVFDANNPACSFQFTTILGGNPNLTPEKSQNYTAGFRLQPTGNLSLEFDSFWVFLKNQIVGGGLNYAVILQNAQTATQFASFINRDASGNIISISQTNANLFRVNLSGFDADLKYGLSMGPGRLGLEVIGTYFYRYDAQTFNGTWTNQLDVGLPTEFGQVGGVLPRWRHTAILSYATEPFNIALIQHYQKGYHDVPSNITGVGRHVSSYDTLDGQISYLGLKSLQFTVGVKNIFNTSPPYANYAASANNFIGGYDLSYGDPLGRDVYARITYYLK
jgi:iron complex outermembrane receptor protein